MTRGSGRSETVPVNQEGPLDPRPPHDPPSSTGPLRNTEEGSEERDPESKE